MRLSRRLSLHLASQYLRTLLATLLALVSISLVVEFVDRAGDFTGAGWARWALELFFWRGLLVAQEMAPAAVILAAGITWANIRRRGELTALQTLAFSPLALMAPFLTVSLLFAGLFTGGAAGGFTYALERTNEINANHFATTSRWMRSLSGNQWLRGERDFYRLGASGGRGFRDVTILSLSPQFRLVRRLDAERMDPVGGHRWRLTHGTVREFEGASSRWEPFEERELELPENPETFQVSRAQPEELEFGALRAQRALRERVGLPTERYTFALHNKVAYPLGAIPGCLLACVIGLRRGRRGMTLAGAVAEGFLMVAGVWMLSVCFRAAALSSSVSPEWGAWMPTLIVGALALAAWRWILR